MSMTDLHTKRARIAAIAAATGFLVVAAFQLALVVGAPLGHAAYGGAHAHLATGYRLVSAFAAVFWTLAALVVLRRAGVRSTPFSEVFARRGTWTLVGLSVISTLMNLASASAWERFGWGPLAAALAVLCFIVARSPSPTDAVDDTLSRLAA